MDQTSLAATFLVDLDNLDNLECNASVERAQCKRQKIGGSVRLPWLEKVRIPQPEKLVVTHIHGGHKEKVSFKRKALGRTTADGRRGGKMQLGRPKFKRGISASVKSPGSAARLRTMHRRRPFVRAKGIPMRARSSAAPQPSLRTIRLDAGEHRFPRIPWAADMCQALRQDLEAMLSSSGLAKRPIRLGTDCAGAEAPYFALQEICAALHAEFGTKMSVDHQFSCDVMRASRRFIARNASPSALFPDIQGRSSISHCLLTQQLRVIPRNLDIYVAGFPCKDFSMLNSQRPGLEGPHAGIFHSVVKYIRDNEPCTFVLENVCGLTVSKNGGPAPIDEVMDILSSNQNYEVRGWKVNTAEFHLPQNRQRVYMVGVHKTKARLRRPIAQWGEHSLTKLKKRPEFSAHAFMLDDVEPEVRAVQAIMCAKEMKRDAMKRDARDCTYGTKWLVKHRKLRTKLRLPQTGPRSLPLTKGEERGWTPYLSERCRDSLELSTGMLLSSGKAVEPVEQTGYLTEISRGVDYSARTLLHTSVITPSGLIWVYNRWRWLIGIEQMALQGFPVDTLDFTDLSESDICTLAGNAMSVPVVGAMLCMVLANVEFLSD